MLRGLTPSAEEIAGTAVLSMVVSNDSIKKATATSQGRRRRAASDGTDEEVGVAKGTEGFIRETSGGLTAKNMLDDVRASDARTCWAPILDGRPEESPR